MEEVVVSGIALTRRVALRGPQRAGQAGRRAKIFGPLAELASCGRHRADLRTRTGAPTWPSRSAGSTWTAPTSRCGDRKQIGAGKVEHEEGIAR